MCASRQPQRYRGNATHAERPSAERQQLPIEQRHALHRLRLRDVDLPMGGPPSPSWQPNPKAPPLVPEHWEEIAVWPRLERCAYLPDDRVVGRSIADVVNELDSHSDWTLRSGENEWPVQFTLALPTGLPCVSKTGRSMSFDMTATLSASASTGAPLEQLAASSIFRFTATSTFDGSALESLHWYRRDFEQSQERAAFEADTGIALDASDEYQQIWWSWHGTLTLANPGGPWSRSGALLVKSPKCATGGGDRAQSGAGRPERGLV
jgi:hypothetical protein